MQQRDYTDDTIMPFGPHKDKAMKDVPAEHLLWLLDQTWIGSYKALAAYLKANKATLLEQSAAANKLKGDVQDAPPMETYEDYLRHYRGF